MRRPNQLPKLDIRHVTNGRATALRLRPFKLRPMWQSPLQLAHAVRGIIEVAPPLTLAEMGSTQVGPAGVHLSKMTALGILGSASCGPDQ